MNMIFTRLTDIEMGRLVTGADNPTVLYVSGGNTQVRDIISTFLMSKLNFVRRKTMN